MTEPNSELKDKSQQIITNNTFSLVISVISLIVSFCSMYFSIFEIRNKVNLLHISTPNAILEKDKIRITDNNNEIVLLNSGNSPILISSIEIVYIQTQPGNYANCTSDSAVVFSTNAPNTIIKPNDAININYKIDRITKRYSFGRGKAEIKDSEILIEKIESDSADVIMDTCLIIGTSTANSNKITPIHVWRSHALPYKYAYDPSTEGLSYNHSVPIIMERGTIF